MAFLWYIKLKHILNTVFKGNHGTGTGRARSLHFQIDNSIFKTDKYKVASIFLNSRSYTAI